MTRAKATEDDGFRVQDGLLPDEGVPTQASYAYREQRIGNLNAARIHNHNGRAEALNSPPAISSTTTAYFRDLESCLIRYITEADAILGCVAWLTNKAILQALAEKDPVALVVQKEDFLRPDIGSGKNWARELRRRYDTLKCTWERFELPGNIVSGLSNMHATDISPVRCMGNYNHDRLSAFPRMHHKFAIFCRIELHKKWGYNEWHEVRSLSPYGVWTGSFNFTENGGRSLENALYITHPEIVNAYLDEWGKVEALSEPLDWETDWIAPEWRLGT